MSCPTRHVARALLALVMSAAASRAADGPHVAALPNLEAASRILQPPLDDRARDLLDAIAADEGRNQELIPLLKALALQPLGQDDRFDVAWTLTSVVGDAGIVRWLDGDEGDQDLALRLIRQLATHAGDWQCQGLTSEHAALHPALVGQLERREGAQREAVMDALLTLDCHLGAVAEPLLRMLSDGREDRRDFARRSLLRCKGGMAWLRGSLAGADDVLATSLADPVRRGIVLELLVSGSCRQSPALTSAIEVELAHASEVERPQLEAALKQVRPLPVR